jgi:hypothetical protein
MAKWDGWSPEVQQVAVTRVLAELLRGLDSNGTTATSVDQAITELDLSTQLSGDATADKLIDLGLFVDSEGLTGAGSDPLITTPHGRAVADEFDAAAGQKMRRNVAARRAMLSWLYQVDRADNAFEILADSASWYYGGQFTEQEVVAATHNLIERKYMIGTKTFQGAILGVQLTPLGQTCVEKYDGEADRAEQQVSIGNQFNFDTYNQQGGNAALGSSVGSQQSTTTVHTSQSSAQDLAVLLETFRQLGHFRQLDDGLDQEAGQVVEALNSDPQGLSRAHRFLTRVQSMAVQPASVALFTALGNFAAVGMGLPAS